MFLERCWADTDIDDFLNARPLGRNVVCVFIIGGRKNIWAGTPIGAKRATIEWKWHTTKDRTRSRRDWSVFVGDHGELQSMRTPMPPNDPSISITSLTLAEVDELPASIAA